LKGVGTYLDEEGELDVWSCSDVGKGGMVERHGELDCSKYC